MLRDKNSNEILDYNKMQNDIQELQKNEIVETGNDSNSSWIKYANGLMIISQKVTYTNVVKNRNFSNFYISQQSLILPNFPIAFTKLYSCNTQIYSSFSVLLLTDEPPSLTSSGHFYPLGFNTDTIESLDVHIIAIGTWK